MKSILDPSFRYTNAASTDLKKTFERVRREQRKQRQQEVDRLTLPKPKVLAFKEKA